MSDVRHAVTVEASPQTVYGILAEATRWPETFRPTVHVEQLERTEIGAGSANGSRSGQSPERR